jgi:MoxR-like ATPase
VEFRHFVQLIAIGLQARIPMHMTGFPGVGKTEFTKSLEAGFDRVGIKCKVVVLVGSIREPQDFGGFPVSTPDGVRLLPMAWARDAKRLAEDGYLVVVFLDELTTVPPTTQAAMLRLLTENVCGELRLPDYEPGRGGVVYLCASNAVEWAAGGQEIQAPMANRLWHGEFPMDHETWCDLMARGRVTSASALAWKTPNRAAGAEADGLLGSPMTLVSAEIFNQHQIAAGV